MRLTGNTTLATIRSRRTAMSIAGVLYSLTTLFLAVGAVNGQNNLLFWAFGLALGGLLVSGVFSGLGLMGLRISRECPGVARVGEPMRIRYHARNANRLLPVFCVTLRESAGAKREDRGQTSAPPTPPIVAFLPSAEARRHSTAEAAALPARRGRLTLELFSASSSFPLGLMRKSIDFEQHGAVLVLPARLRLRAGLIPSPARRGQGGAASPSAVGLSDEFFGVREYVPGDSPRLIAWRPSARGDALVVRQQGAPPPTIVWIVLDAPPGSPDLASERAVAIAAALVESVAQRGGAVGLSAPSQGLTCTPAPGQWHARRIVNLLATLDLAAPRRAAPATAGIRREHAAIVIHAAGPGDAGPDWATHLHADRIRDYLEPGEPVPPALLPPPEPETPEQRRRRLIRAFFMVDAPDEPQPAGVPR